MGLPLKCCAVVAAVMCPAVFAGNAQPGETTGSSANWGKWWVRTAQTKKADTRQQIEELEARNELQAETFEAEASDESRPTDGSSASCYGYSFAQHHTDHFHLMYRQQEMPSPIVKQTGELLEHAYDKFVSEFKKAGFALGSVDERLTWVVFNNEHQYRDYARLADGMNTPYLESYYAARSNQVVLMQVSAASRWNRDTSVRRRSVPANTVNPQVAGMDEPSEAGSVNGGGGMLDVRRAVHEAAHQLAFNTGLQKRGVMYPLWVSEGLATNFECDSAKEIDVAGDNAPRNRQLMRAWSNGRLMPLSSFVTLVNIRSGEYSANDLYAESWAFFNFLFKTRKSELKAYLTELAEAEPGPRDSDIMMDEFTRAFGSLDRLERAWDKHLESMSRK